MTAPQTKMERPEPERGVGGLRVDIDYSSPDEPIVVVCEEYGFWLSQIEAMTLAGWLAEAAWTANPSAQLTVLRDARRQAENDWQRSYADGGGRHE